MATTTKLMPSASSGTPKEKRAVPEVTSVPTSPNNSPSTIMPSALMSEPCANTPEATRPSTISEKYSGDWNWSASAASGGGPEGEAEGAPAAAQQQATDGGGA